MALSGAAACIGSIGDSDDHAGGSAGPSGDDRLPPGTDKAELMPARIRRLTNAEYDASVRALTGLSVAASAGFPPDARQDGFTVNAAQRVDPVLAKQLDAVATDIAAEVKGKLEELAPCSDAATQGESCATDFIRSFGERAYRRPLDQEEADALLTVYRVGAKEAGYADGIELLVRAVLQSPGFLYVTEIGESPGSSGVVLSPYELASSLAYVITAAPPDEALLGAAKAGALSTPDGREQEARRLLATPAARERLGRVISEWLGLDQLAVTAKDSNVYPEFEALRGSMEQETSDFIDAVLWSSTGTIGELLGADWTVVDEPLARFYGAPGAGRVALADRRGILNQGAFLSVFAHATETAPVLRGVAVMRRVACIPVASPTELDIDVVPPVPDPNKTTRERFAVHSQDPACKSCHASIDAFGFSFERFDGMGRLRTLDNGRPVDSNVTVSTDTTIDGAYADSNALAKALASSAEVRACFARHLFRASSGSSDSGVAEAETSFLKAWSAAPAAGQGSIVDALIAYVRSDIFAYRRSQ